MNLPYGTTLTWPHESYADIPADNNLYNDRGIPIFAERSKLAKMHAARNDDGRGLERGTLTYAIAFAPRAGDLGHRFTEAEIALLRQEYSRWLRPYEVILFNDEFFRADVDDLQRLADQLNIKIKQKER